MANAKRAVSDFMGDRLDVKMFGAVGDGVTDDISALTSAIVAAQAHGGRLYVPPGIYRISDTLEIGPPGIVLEGASGAMALTRFEYTGTGTAVKVINPAPTAVSPWTYRIYIRNLGIRSTQGRSLAAIGLDLHNVSEFELKDVVVGGGTDQGFGIGVRGAVNIGVFSGLICAGNVTGLSLEWFDEPLGPSSPCGMIDIGGFSNFFQNDTGIVIYGLADSHIHACWFEQFANAILMDNDLTPAEGNVMHSVTVDNCSFSGYTIGSYTDNRALRFRSSDNAKKISAINLRWHHNSCYAQGTAVIECTMAGSHAATLFEGAFQNNELWGGTAGAIYSDSAAKTFVLLGQNDSRDGFFGAAVPDIDPAALISVNGHDVLFGDFDYANFRRGIKTNFTSKFYTPLGNSVWLLGDDTAYIVFQPDSATGLQRGLIGYPSSTTVTYGLQIVNNVSGEPIVLLTTGSGPTRINGGPLETNSGYGALAVGSINPNFGGGGGTANLGSLSWGDGTGYKYVLGTKSGGVFTPRFQFDDRGIFEFAAGSNLYCGSGTPEGAQAAPVGSLYLRTNGGAGTSLYVKESGTGNTGWIAIATDTGTPVSAFTDRGDPAAPDATQATLTIDSAWHDWDMSAVVPAGATSVLIRCLITNSAAESVLNLRKNGNSNTINMASIRTPAAQLATADLVVPCDANRVIEYYVVNAGTYTDIDLTIAGWWK